MRVESVVCVSVRVCGVCVCVCVCDQQKASWAKHLACFLAKL